MVALIESESVSACNAEPYATYRWASVGTMNSSTLSSSARWNAARSSDMKNNGPPRKMTVPWIGRPEARPAMVCVATAVKMDAARSGLAAPSLMSGCKSVLANTPQREAIG